MRYADLIKQMEHTHVVPVTEAMRDWFAVMGMPLNPATTSFILPSFPILSNMQDTMANIVEDHLLEEIPKNMGKAAKEKL